MQEQYFEAMALAHSLSGVGRSCVSACDPNDSVNVYSRTDYCIGTVFIMHVSILTKTLLQLEAWHGNLSVFTSSCIFVCTAVIITALLSTQYFPTN